MLPKYPDWSDAWGIVEVYIAVVAPSEVVAIWFKYALKALDEVDGPGLIIIVAEVTGPPVNEIDMVGLLQYPILVVAIVKVLIVGSAIAETEKDVDEERSENPEKRAVRLIVYNLDGVVVVTENISWRLEISSKFHVYKTAG